MDITTLDPGDRVRAFNPRTLGVVQEPIVVKVGRKYVHLNYGSMWGGTQRVRPVDVLELVHRARTVDVRLPRTNDTFGAVVVESFGNGISRVQVTDPRRSFHKLGERVDVGDINISR